MSILVLVVAALVAGFIASKLINKTGEGYMLDVILAMVGGLAARWLFSAARIVDAGGLNVASFAVALTGAMIVLVTYHRFVRKLL